MIDDNIGVGDLVTWKADGLIITRTGNAVWQVPIEVGVVVGLESRGDDDSRSSGAWVKWACNATGWSPIEFLVPLPVTKNEGAII